MLHTKYRLTQQKDFLRIKRKGNSRKASMFYLNWLSNRLPHARFGFIATKKIGTAVQRNRGIRLLREAIRLHIDDIQPGIDYVFVLRKRIIGVSYSSVEREVIAVLQREQLFTKNV